MLTDHYFLGGLRGSVDVSCALCHHANNLQTSPNTANTKPIQKESNQLWTLPRLPGSHVAVDVAGWWRSKAKATQRHSRTLKMHSSPSWMLSCQRPGRWGIDGGSMGIDGNRWDSWLLKSAWCLMDFYDRRWWERCVWKVCGWCSANV